ATMNLATRIAVYFPSTIRSRGDTYAVSGRVTIVRGSPTEVIAGVEGTQQYTVIVTARGSKVTASCNCPYADDDLCKHIWATLRASDRGGHLSAAARAPSSLSLVHQPTDA